MSTSTPYPAYRDSGIPWLGLVPAHWEVTQFKRLADIQNGADHKHIECEEGYPVYGSGGVFAYASAFLYDGESVLLGRKGTIDKPLHVVGKFWTVDTMYWTKLAPDAAGRFVYYAALTIPFGYYSTNTALPSMTKGDLSSHMVPLPPLAEQRAIAGWLDGKTGQIDAAVAAQRTLLDQLKEKRRALIAHAVTRGLDPAAPLRDSGIPWLGQVPAHWEVWKFSHAFESIGSGTTPTSSEPQWYEDGTIPWVTTGELRENIVTDTSNKVTSAALKQFSALKIHPKGSLVIAMYGATIGRLGVLGVPATMNQACCALSGTATHDVQFVAYWFGAFKVPIIENFAVGGGQPNISLQVVSNLLIPTPPLAEQQAIAAYLDTATAALDDLAAETARTLTLLQEHRTALIAGAVTGKFRVPGVPA